MSAIRRLFGGGGDAGQMMVLAAAALLALLFGVGLAIDTGALFSARNTMRAGADAGAWAGAVVLYKGGTTSEAAAAAESDMSLDGLSDSGSATITVNVPPVSGPFANDTRFVEVIVSQLVRTTFIPSGGGLTAITVRAVAGAAPGQTGYALMQLDQTASQALFMTGSGGISVTGGSLIDDSGAPDAAVRLGSVGVLTVPAPYTANAVGGEVNLSQVRTGSPSVPDPYARYPTPATSGLPIFSNTIISQTATLAPGVYVNGINISGNATVTFEPGMYIIKGGGIYVSGGTNLIGSGITIFNTLSNYPTETGTCGPLNFSGGGQLMLTAPTSGAYSGMLMYQDRTCTQMVTLTGNGAITSPSGTIYAPTANITVTGTGGLTVNGQIVSDTLSVTGTGGLRVNYSGATTAAPIVPALVE